MRQLARGASLAALMGAALPAAAQTYNRVDEVMDWGAVTTKLIVDTGAPVTEAVAPDDFAVTVTRTDSRVAEPLIRDGAVEITRAYVSDAEGRETAEGRFVTLVPRIGPDVRETQALNYAEDPAAGRSLNAWTENAYTVTRAGEVVADEMGTYTRPYIDDFTFGSETYEDADYGTIDLGYALFTPPEDDRRNPLIVWYHGGGEGGTDPTIPLAPNRANMFAADDIQSRFGGAYVLVPQAPTRWMEGPTWDGGTEPKPDALSIYTRAAQDLTESIIAQTPDIDPDRIYVGGLSNGGWMTVRLLLDYPDYYTAGVAVCEPLELDFVSDEELAGIVDVPLWIVTAATDTTVDAAEYPADLYNRLIQAGAQDVQFSYLPRVVDTSGDYTDADGSPYEYPGHFSWIPVYNDDLAYIDGGGGQIYGALAREVDEVGGRPVVTLMDWWSSR